MILLRSIAGRMLLTMASTAACFPTLHNARVDPGFRLDVGATALADGRPNEAPDYMAYVSPVYGIGRRLELGVPIGVYWQHGFRGEPIGTATRQWLLQPYLKLALLEGASANHLAIVAQSAAVFPNMLGIRYGRDLRSWEPHFGVSLIASGGEAGDDPFVTRYQQPNQSLTMLSAGATWNRAGYPGVEVGLLRNAFDERMYNQLGPVDTRRTYYDLFIALRLSTGTLQQQDTRRARRCHRREHGRGTIARTHPHDGP